MLMLFDINNQVATKLSEKNHKNEHPDLASQRHLVLKILFGFLPCSLIFASRTEIEINNIRHRRFRAFQLLIIFKN